MSEWTYYIVRSGRPRYENGMFIEYEEKFVKCGWLARLVVSLIFAARAGGK